ncbi:MAG: proline racemase family protein [Pirellulales bacterium]|nr:proline racemase family protein [Pirellulales bacterium]
MHPTLQYLDTHTAGEPTRVVYAGGPELGVGPLSSRVAQVRANLDQYRRALIHEPRGWPVLVGAWLVPPHNPACTHGVIFFNNVGYLGMCGHGLIGVVAALAHLGQITPGEWKFDTPVGEVGVMYHTDKRVTLTNVPSYCHARDVAVDVPGIGAVMGDVAWGGNWFYLIEQHGQRLELANTADLTEYCLRVRRALAASGITGDDGAEIDHIELFGPPVNPANNSRNFVLCPGGEYDRSPCGTGTSAKLACLAARGKLAAGQPWRQESILGTVFSGEYRWEGESAKLEATRHEAAREHSSPAPSHIPPGLTSWPDIGKPMILPRITGAAYVTSAATLVLDPEDPFCWGL